MSQKRLNGNKKWLMLSGLDQTKLKLLEVDPSFLMKKLNLVILGKEDLEIAISWVFSLQLLNFLKELKNCLNKIMMKEKVAMLST